MNDKSVALLLDGRADLLLTSVVRNADGSIKSGEVVNGAWTLNVRDGEVYCDNGPSLRSRPAWVEIEIPDHVGGDYNEILEWAESHHRGLV